MREVKFRAKSGTQWRYGDLYHDERGELMIYEPKTSGRTLDGVTFDGWRIKVDPESVGQYTGLRDADGREIYEGDILSQDGEPDNYEVVWFDLAGSWELRSPKKHYLFVMRAIDIFKVIGNVYDNPELLERKP